MNVQYTATTRAKLSTLPVSNGQIIALTDESAYYYDMSNERHVISGLRVVAGLPSAGEVGCLYLNTNSTPYRLYIWDATDIEFVDVGGQYNAGAGLTLSNSSIKANLLSETALSNDAAAATEVSGRVYPIAIDHSGHLAVVVPWENTTYETVSKTAAGLCPQLPNEQTTSKYLRQDGQWITPPGATYGWYPEEEDGPELSLVTTGEKYEWNHKASGDHTHPVSIASGSSASSEITLAHDASYTLTAGGSTFGFTMPSAPQGGVTGVKGSTESTYRTGDVSLSASDVGALGVTIATGTLASGSTSITISDVAITTSSTILAVCADDPNLTYNDISVATGSVTITFSAQSAAKGIKVFIV